MASRGKLRGLFLPIAGGQKEAPAEPKRPDRKRKIGYDAEPSSRSVPAKPNDASLSTSVTTCHTEFVDGIEPRSRPINMPNDVPWHQIPSPVSNGTPPLANIPPMSTNPFKDHTGLPFSRNPISGRSDNDFRTSPMYTPSPQETTCFGSSHQDQQDLPHSFQNYVPSNEPFRSPWHSTPFGSEITSVSNATPSNTASEFSVFMGRNVADTSETNTLQEEEEVNDDVAYGKSGRYTTQMKLTQDQNLSTFNSLSSEYALSLSPFSGMTSIGKTPRMRYLINYYAEVISPVIVAFDSPSNPYRTHILQLAAGSETLQHAISALSASNIRQRRETGVLSTGKTDPARRSSMAHQSLTDSSWLSGSNRLTLQDHAREESFHKAFSVQSLNAQLANPMVRKDDSILATLLVLCLFHICDSGIAKFKTQFAGVKKLLTLRDDDGSGGSRSTKWFTRMFTWFDAMTATVNDREGQLGEIHLDMSAMSDEEWALENLAGCDGRLFKTIARLGRLNVLSQGQTVDCSPRMVSRPFPVVSPYSNFDGNGWSQVINDEDLFASRQTFHSRTAEPDIPTQFWNEWRDIRNELQAWSLDTSLFDSSSSETSLLSPDQRIDLANISESFRYSALLYTERLASPAAASSDANIQAWVQGSLKFIKLVKSDVFLLWPLFITGSECATEDDRSLIRERCLDIQKDSGFLNNYSCLELMEKVWKANPPAFEGRSLSVLPRSGGFNFSHIMRQEKTEGEYIVV